MSLKNNKPVLIICIIFFLLTEHTFAETTTLKGFAPTYAGDKITFYSHQNYFSYTKINHVSALVNDSGYFKCQFDLKETMKLYADHGVFNMYFYAEPGKEYELMLPEKVVKETKDQLNPYFEPVMIQLGIKGAKADDLNVMLRMFDDSYIPYYNKHVINVAKERDFTRLDEDIAKITKPFTEITHDYFKTYMKYRIGLLKFFTTQNKANKIFEDYFKNEKIYYNNPAYMELFNQVFNNFFTFMGRTNDGKKFLDKLIQYENIESIEKILKDQVQLNASVIELIVLKNIYDEFYLSNFSRTTLLNVLDSLAVKTVIEEHRIMAGCIKSEITKLMKGFVPPQFELYNQDSTLVKLSELKGKYIYLNFCLSNNYTCIQEYESLKYLYEEYHEKLEIITVSVDISFAAMVRARKQLNCPWTFIHYGSQPEIVGEYDIRAFPTYFLIDKEGRLIISPAPSPGENFEKSFVEILRSRGEI